MKYVCPDCGNSVLVNRTYVYRTLAAVDSEGNVSKVINRGREDIDYSHTMVECTDYQNCGWFKYLDGNYSGQLSWLNDIKNKLAEYKPIKSDTKIIEVNPYNITKLLDEQTNGK